MGHCVGQRPSPSASMVSASRLAVTTWLAPPRNWTSVEFVVAMARRAGKYLARSTDPSKSWRGWFHLLVLQGLTGNDPSVRVAPSERGLPLLGMFLEKLRSPHKGPDPGRRCLLIDSLSHSVPCRIEPQNTCKLWTDGLRGPDSTSFQLMDALQDQPQIECNHKSQAVFPGSQILDFNRTTLIYSSSVFSPWNWFFSQLHPCNLPDVNVFTQGRIRPPKSIFPYPDNQQHIRLLNLKSF